MTAAPFGVGLLGLGTVGSAVARAMETRAQRLEAMAGTFGDTADMRQVLFVCGYETTAH